MAVLKIWTCTPLVNQSYKLRVKTHRVKPNFLLLRLGERTDVKEKYLLMWDVLTPRHQFGLVLKVQKLWIQNYEGNFCILPLRQFLQRCGTFWDLKNENLDNW